MNDNLAHMSEEITPERFESWVKIARPGDRLTYHVGLLATDRERSEMLAKHNTYAHVYYEPIHSVGLYAMYYYEQGVLELVQRKMKPGVYEYIAIKRKTKRRKPQWQS